MNDSEIQTLLAKFDLLSSTYLRDEVDEALNHQEALTPHLLRIIEDAAENPLRQVLEEHNAHVYAATLLSHFREPAAHLPLVRAFSVAPEPLADLWGDMTTETLPTLLYNTCDGSIEAIKELVVNRTIDQYVRCAAMEALSYVAAFEPSRRDEVVQFLQGLFTGEEADRESYFWGNLTATLCDLHPGDSMEIIRKAFDDKIVQPGFIGWGNVEVASELSREAAQESLQTWVKARMPADIHGYISWFAEFHQEELEQPPEKPEQPEKKNKPENKKKSGDTKNKAAKKARKKNRR
jgi:hypothetical protein